LSPQSARFEKSQFARLGEGGAVINKSFIAIVLIFLVGAISYRYYLRSKVRTTQVPAPPTDPNQFMPDIAAHAVQVAQEQGKTLDYSPKSVKIVESILGELHEAHVKGSLSDDQVKVMALRYGAYIGEVLRRTYGGTWATDHSVAGPRSYPIRWKKHESFPVGWCGKRILNGDEDNVWFKFQVFTSDRYQSLATSEPVDPKNGR
jgi:hypothetical protein